VVLAAAPFFAYVLSMAYVDIAWIFVFGILGVAAKIFGWNRFLLHLGFVFGIGFEEKIRSTMLATVGDNSLVFSQAPISGTLLVTVLAVLAGAAVLSARRYRGAP